MLKIFHLHNSSEQGPLTTFGSLIFLHFNILHSLCSVYLIATQRFALAKILSVNAPIDRKFPLYSPLYEFPLSSDFTFLVVRLLSGLISTIDFIFLTDEIIL